MKLQRFHTCNDCGEKYYKATGYKYDICLDCLDELIDSGGDPDEKQPSNKGDYKPRYNGFRALGEN